MVPGCLESGATSGEVDQELLDHLQELSTFPEWRLETDQGAIRMILYTGWLPTTTSNIIQVTNSGYYTDTTMYRVVDDFVIQGGDEDESDAEILAQGDGVPLETIEGLDFGTGAVGLARLSRDDGTAHYFVAEKPALHLSRPGSAEQAAGSPSQDSIYRGAIGEALGPYALFGQVFEGMDVVRSIAEVPVDGDDKPLHDVDVYTGQVLPPPSGVDFINLIPNVYDDVNTQGHDGIFEAPRYVLAGHPATFRFTTDTREGGCSIHGFILQHPGGERYVMPWDINPIDACTFEATIVFEETGSYGFDLGDREIPIQVAPWNDAYRPYTGTQNA